MRLVLALIVSASIILIATSRSSSQEMKYPREVKLDAFHPAKTEICKDWYFSNNEPNTATLRRPAFFSKDEDLVIRCTRGTSQDLVQLLKHDRPLVEFKYSIMLAGILPAAFFDFDGNGLTDIKLTSYLGGCGGNSNTARATYLFQHPDHWRLISFFLRDPSYSWECDLDGDGKYELLNGHHQDKQKPGFHDRRNKKWVPAVFRKYLIINAYSPDKKKGLTLCNRMRSELPLILPFTDDPFDVRRDRAFLQYNQFKQPQDLIILTEKITR